MAKRRKTGGRKAGMPNKSTEGIRVLLGRVLPDGRLEKEWEHYLRHRNPHLRFEAFKLANSYLFGKPVQPVVGEELLPPIKIDISAIPCHRELAE
jgi:hypothetical protein